MTRNTDSLFQAAEVFPPGAFLREEIEARQWTQEEFAAILGRPLQTVNQIINGKKEITPETAIALANALGTSPEVWLNLESAYRLAKARQNPDASDPDVARRARLRSIVPMHELQRIGWLRETDDLDELESEVCTYLAIKSLDQTPALARGIAARKAGGKTEPDLTPSQLAWAYRVKYEAAAMKVARYDPKRFASAAPNLPHLSVDRAGMRRVVGDLGDLGVRVVFVPALQNTKIDGAAFWLDYDAPVVGLSLRYDRIDSFWFTLMHELGHIFLEHGRSSASGLASMDDNLVGQGAQSPQDKPQRERDADQLASDWLIPSGELRAFIRRTKPYYSAKRVEAFAQEMHVHRGVVVGRLQHMGEIPWRNLRRALVKASDLITA